MGLFNKTEEEIRLEQERKKLKDLKEIVRSSKNMDSITNAKLIKAIDDVLNGGKNIFFDVEFLTSIILDMVSDYSKVSLEGMIRCIRDIFPYGSDSPDFNVRKELFINNFLGEYGFINKEIYDYSIYSSFNNIDNYIRVMNSISKNEIAVEHFNQVKNYINKSSKYAIDEESFTLSLISTINKLDVAVLDINNYLENELEEDKKRIGIYSISHDDILQATSSMSKIEAEIDKASNLINVINEKVIEVRKTTDDGLSTMNRSKDQIIRDLNNYKESLEKELKVLLENHLDNVKLELNDKADHVFEELLNKYQEQLSEFKRASKNLSTTSTRELTRLKEETDKSLNQLRDYVNNNPELQSYLTQAEESAEVRDKLLDLIKNEKDKLGTIVTGDTKMVEGISRIVIPDSPSVVVPESINIPKDIQIIPSYAYKNAKGYAKILKAAKNAMEVRQAKGEIFHKKVMEILECLLVGDWPYMFGPSGAGKGFIVSQVGSLLGQHVVDGGKIGEVHTVLGYIDAQGRFRATPAVEACTNGDLIFFDEFDNGNPDTRVALNTMYSNLREKILHPETNQYIRFAGEIDIPINPNMRMIAAGNTDGTGSDELFTDRYPTDESIKERYKPIFVDYDNAVEESILEDYSEWYNFFIAFREACDKYAKNQGMQTAPGNASTRDASDILRDVTLNAKTLDEMINQYFVQIKDQEYRSFLGRLIARNFSIPEDNNFEDYNYEGTLAEANSTDIAKQFIKRCKIGIRG